MPADEIEVTHNAQAAFWGATDSQYVATFGGYDLDCLIGTGRTPLDAIVDLLDQSELEEVHALTLARYHRFDNEGGV